jgi:prepilin-type N-terminal cleavage/methylation domain-containing protein/prepilin-type processing-associated H-X9-DG protein
MIQCRRAAFTIVELLVVVSVIAVLASLLVPAIGIARAAAQTASCASNQRQLFAVLLLYAQDNQGLLPLAYAAPFKQGSYFIETVHQVLSGPGALWQDGLLDQARFAYCPAQADPRHRYDTPENPWPPGQGQRLRLGYALRPVTPYAADGDGSYLGPLPMIDHLAGLAVLADPLDQGRKLDSGHGDGVNATYADGHVAWVSRRHFAAELDDIVPGLHQEAHNPVIDAIWARLDAAQD